jgi:uncharacterized membrane protein YphA (DoxX/SURF4 family)
MNIALWISQGILAVLFLFQGIVKFSPPPDLPASMAWTYDIPAGFSIFIGIVELLAVAGLLLPGITKIQTRLTPLAATGLIFTMIGAIIFHATRGEIAMIPGNIIWLLLSAFVAYGRWKLSPLQERQAN